jgi:hypothetical protein
MAYRPVLLLESSLVTVAVAATRPSADGDGVDITGWRLGGGFGPSRAALFLDGSEAQTLTSPTGGADGPELWGYRLSQWWRLGYLNNGADIVIAGASQGFPTEVDVVGIFERLAVAATPSAGTTTAKFAPLQESPVL